MSDVFAAKQPSQRQLRVGEQIRHVLSRSLLEEEFYGTVLEGLSVTVAEVRVSPDLKNSTAYVSILGGNTPEGFIEALSEESARLRYLVGRHLKLRHVPLLQFKKDDSFEQASRIYELLDHAQDPDQ